MSSDKSTAALHIAHALRPAEAALNDAAGKVLTAGAAILAPRADGTFHPLEGQAAVDELGQATAQLFAALKSVRSMHLKLRAVGRQHEIVGEGVVWDTPDTDTPRQSAQGQSLRIVA